MNEYQKETVQTLKLLFKAAQSANGRVLDAGAVRRVCSYIQSLIRTIEQQVIMLEGADGLLEAYVNEYGKELMDTLTAEAAQEVYDAEIVEEGSDDEGLGVDAQVEAEEE